VEVATDEAWISLMNSAASSGLAESLDSTFEASPRFPLSASHLGVSGRKSMPPNWRIAGRAATPSIHRQHSPPAKDKK